MEHASDKVVGVKQTRKALLAGSVERILVAEDAERRILAPIEELCRQQGIEIVRSGTMSELGHRYGIEVGAAVVAVLKPQ